MTTAITKLQLGVGALALGAAATLAPVVAQADTTVAPLRPALTSFSQALGETAGQPLAAAVCDPNTTDCSLAVTANQTANSVASWITPIFQNQLWWFGTPNPNPPTQTTVYTFYPLALVPEFLQPLFGWFENINFEGCILGATLNIGPYGTVSGSYSRGCA